MKRRMLTAVAWLLVAVLCLPPLYAAAEQELTVAAQVNNSTGLVTITGVTALGAGQEITVLVLAPGGAIQYINQATSGEDGKFAFHYTLSGAVEGSYTVTVNGAGANGPVSSTFTYARQQQPNPSLPATVLTVNVAFDAQGGEVEPREQAKQYGSTYQPLPIAVKIGYVFGGWYTGAGGTGKEITNATVVEATADHTLYAKWLKGEEQEGTEETGETGEAGETEELPIPADITGHWAEAAIKRAIGSGLAVGYPDGSFRPDRTISRSEFIVLLMRAFKPSTAFASAELAFTDTAQIGGWARAAIGQAVEAGIIRGYADGSFRPGAGLTRAEMAVLAARVLSPSLPAAGDAQASFADRQEIPAWASASVAAMQQASIMQGKGKGRFAPGASANRAEAVTVILNMMDY